MQIDAIIETFLRQEIQSEAEVRSKLIIPLLEVLGYPIDFRAEEFPIYGYEGSRKLSAKYADFLQFTDKDFANNRENKTEQLHWVYEHSLLVFEAKKPTETIEGIAQPIFYSAWTRCPAFVISNGKRIEGYLINSNWRDTRVFSCRVEDIPLNWNEIIKFRYTEILRLKQASSDRPSFFVGNVFEKYISAMRVQCAKKVAIYADRSFANDSEYHPKIQRNQISLCENEVYKIEKCLLTAVPGGGKTVFIWKAFQHYLDECLLNDGPIPVLLEGRCYRNIYNSIEDGIYKKLQYFAPSTSKEKIHELICDGRIVLLFDGLDEVEGDIQIIGSQLKELSFNESFQMIVTARRENYHGELQTTFTHVVLNLLAEKQISELLEKYSQGRIKIDFYSLPHELREILAVPLFLKMYVTITMDERNRIPKNKAELFELYLRSQFQRYNYSGYEITKLRQILSKYAFQSFDNNESLLLLTRIIEENVDQGKREEYYGKVWKIGILQWSDTDIKFYHRTMMEYCYAFHLAEYSEEHLLNWLEEHHWNKKYLVIICYLTGIISNQEKQNVVLDYLERKNLSLYSKALKSRRDFSSEIAKFDEDFVKNYFSQLRESYITIISSHFSRLQNYFDGCIGYPNIMLTVIDGAMDYQRNSISVKFYGGPLDCPVVRYKIYQSVGMSLSSGAGWTDANEYVMTTGGIRTFGYNLKYTGYDIDSAREIALDIVKKQVFELLKKKQIFDNFYPVLAFERLEHDLRKLRQQIEYKDIHQSLSLYRNSLEDIIEILKTSGEPISKEFVDFCCFVQSRFSSPKKYMDLEGDLTDDLERRSFVFYELYSDKRLVKKIENILLLQDETVQRIISEYLLFLKPFYQRTKVIGFITKEKYDSIMEYVRVKETKNFSPIIEIVSERVDAMQIRGIDPTVEKKLISLGKSTYDIVSCGGSGLNYAFWGEYVFHQRIYGELEDLMKKVF